jgi:hypothetical protein
MEVESNFCSDLTYRNISDTFQYDIRFQRKLRVSEIMARMTRMQWMQKQSFCFGKKDFVLLTPILTKLGLCYAYNMDEDMLDKST